MRCLALFLSIYCILLAVLPCQDKEDMSAGITQLTIQNQKSSNQHHIQDTCPPFCNCSCCSNARQLVAKSVLIFLAEATDFSYPDYSIPATQSQNIAIWQPPQLS